VTQRFRGEGAGLFRPDHANIRESWGKIAQACCIRDATIEFAALTGQKNDPRLCSSCNQQRRLAL
jgi:hypothetical protein